MPPLVSIVLRSTPRATVLRWLRAAHRAGAAWSGIRLIDRSVPCAHHCDPRLVRGGNRDDEATALLLAYLSSATEPFLFVSIDHPPTAPLVFPCSPWCSIDHDRGSFLIGGERVRWRKANTIWFGRDSLGRDAIAADYRALREVCLAKWPKERDLSRRIWSAVANELFTINSGL